MTEENNQAIAEPETNTGVQNELGQSFDELLKNGHQAEFDRRVTKALQTARSKWEQEQAEGQDEAAKLARMSEAQRTKYQLDKERQSSSGLTRRSVLRRSGRNT